MPKSPYEAFLEQVDEAVRISRSSQYVDMIKEPRKSRRAIPLRMDDGSVR